MVEDAKALEGEIAAVFEAAASAAAELAAADELRADIAKVAALVIDRIRADGKVLLCGNGGSAADCQHIAGEFVGRFALERKGLPAIALSTDTTILTSIANDYGFDDVFRRQVEALGREGDVLLAYSTSGMSPNCLRAVEQAREMGIHSVTLTGRAGGTLAEAADIALKAPAILTARVQECHATIGHALCKVIERALCGDSQKRTGDA
jgi:D-sedoheptulose 7-phosphate isomerase